MPASIAVYRRKVAELDGLIEQLRAVRAQVGAQLLRAEAELPHGPEPRCELGTEKAIGKATGKATEEGE